MARILRNFVLGLIGFSLAEESDVVTLTEANFDEFVKNHPKTLVEFYAPWCGHCKSLAPHYEEAATSLKAKNVHLAKVDATEEKALASRFEIKGFPTLLWFPEGLESLEYDGGRTAQGIEEWVAMMSGPAVREVESPEEPVSKAVVTLYGPTLLDSFQKCAVQNRRSAIWLYVKASELKVTIRHKDEDVIEVTDSALIEDSSELAKVWSSHSFPLFGMLNGETYGKYMERTDYGLVWTLFPMESSEDMESVIAENRQMMLQVAANNTDYSFTYTDTVLFKAAVENMLGVTEFPALAVFKKAGDRKKFIYNGEMTAEALNAFIAEVEEGKVEPTLKSEEVPAENNEGVRVVVGKSLKEEVFVADKDVLLEIYAPWCGHCKKLEPEYNALAENVSSVGADSLLTIAKLDGAANESPVDSISWEGFPTLFYIKAGSSEPMKYLGGRDAASMLDWIKQNHSKKDEFAAKFADSKDDARDEL